MSQTNKHPEIAVIGAGFSGLMTAIHLIREASGPLTIHIINDKLTFGKGAAYSTQSSKHLLNVTTAKLGAFGTEPTHFLDWVLRQPEYKNTNKEALGKTFLSRKLFGQYIGGIWEETLANKRKDTHVNIVHDQAEDIDLKDERYEISLKAQAPVMADYIVLATGNEAPSNPRIPNTKFYESRAYIKNPWLTDVAKLIPADKDILIIGNGLTTVDQVISLMEAGYKGTIHTLSPRGFSILPHRFSHIEYKDFANEIKEPYIFEELFTLGRKHFRKLYRIGISAEPIADSLRPLSQKIWQGLSHQDKEHFLQKFRPTWNTIRHRVAPHLYDLIQGLRVKGKLVVHKGSLIDICEGPDGVTMEYMSRNTKAKKSIKVGLVINCTGPHTDISRSENTLIKSLVTKGMIKPDPLRIGMDVTESWSLIDTQGQANNSLYTLGSNLKGLYWETTAIPEIRVQAAKLAKQILETAKTAQSPVTVSR